MKKSRSIDIIKQISWFVTQLVILCVSLFVMFNLGVYIAAKTGYLDILYWTVIGYVALFVYIKCKIEDNFDNNVEE